MLRCIQVTAPDGYWARDNTHMADALVAYVPQAKVMV
jgi:hypothetical protein